MSCFPGVITLMKIAYLLHLNFEPQSGVYKKILAQIRIWISAGHNVAVFCATRNLRVALSLRIDTENIANAFIIIYKPGYHHLLDRLRALNHLTKEISRWKPDVVFSREDLYYPNMKVIAQKFPVVKEINSKTDEELYLHSKLQWAYYLSTRKIVDRLIAGFVFVSRELMALSYYKYNFKNRIKAVIGNGVDFSTIPHLPIPRNKKPSLLFIGQPAPWHGIDRISELASLFPQWQFHLVGYNKKDFVFPCNVKAYGIMDLDEYIPIAAQCHVAVGALAIFREKMGEASPLKVREYLAMGLPTIIAYEDTDFPNGAPFLLSLPNNNRELRAYRERIEGFVATWMEKRVPREAVRFLDWREKEKQRLAIFQEAVRYWRMKNDQRF